MGEKPQIAVLVLAAGASTRMGGALKQLLPWKDTTLLGHAISQAKASKADDVFIVLGAQASKLRSQFGQNGTTLVENEQWASGMGTSIACGVAYLTSHKKDWDGVLVMLCDQPLVDTAYLNTLIDTFTANGIVATDYGGRRGVPALFSKTFFQELALLKEDYGAREVLLRHREDVIVLNGVGKTADVDTPEDYKNLK
ncbi:nucleotidyltransferase family protein [Spongiimicrobium sp. 2-473A-2-J]|uniref:nucleotidyltransferase family protein n=1 Tax=Eudoraea algarum TaxID=3417568 RepID=UPI003D36DA52